MSGVLLGCEGRCAFLDPGPEPSLRNIGLTRQPGYPVSEQREREQPVAALVAMKGTLEQSTLVALQRLAGATIGAIVAAIFLTSVQNTKALLVVIVLLGALAGMTRAASYTWYCACVAALVLIAMDIPHPNDLTDEGRRILFTFVGVGIAVVVTLLAGLLVKREAARAKPASAAQT